MGVNDWTIGSFPFYPEPIFFFFLEYELMIAVLPTLSGSGLGSGQH